MSVVLHLHVHLTYIVGALRDSLDGELLQCHGLMDDTLQRLDGSIHRTISGSTVFKLLTSNIEPDTCNVSRSLTGRDLEVVELHGVSSCLVCTGEHQHIVISDLLLLVSQFEEFLVDLVETLGIFDVYSIDL